MRVLFHLIVMALFLFPITYALFRILIGFRTASAGKKNGDASLVKRGRIMAMNSFVLLLFILAFAWFLFNEFLGWNPFG